MIATISIFVCGVCLHRHNKHAVLPRLWVTRESDGDNYRRGDAGLDHANEVPGHVRGEHVLRVEIDTSTRLRPPSHRVY